MNFLETLVEIPPTESVNRIVGNEGNIQPFQDFVGMIGMAGQKMHHVHGGWLVVKDL